MCVCLTGKPTHLALNRNADIVVMLLGENETLPACSRKRRGWEREKGRDGAKKRRAVVAEVKTCESGNKKQR